jgi:CheY-like chemotaxis protein
MPPEIKILVLEDVPAEAARLDRELARAGLVFRSRRVERREEFVQALIEQPPDVILSDHGLPSFDGLAALALAQEKCPEVPFIFVTNALTPEMEIEKLTGVVADCVPKSRLEALPVVLLNALRRVEKSRPRPATEPGVKVETAPVIPSVLPICSGCRKIRDQHNQWKPAEEFFRELLNIRFTHGLCPDCTPKYFPGVQPPLPPSSPGGA